VTPTIRSSGPGGQEIVSCLTASRPQVRRHVAGRRGGVEPARDVQHSRLERCADPAFPQVNAERRSPGHVLYLHSPPSGLRPLGPRALGAPERHVRLLCSATRLPPPRSASVILCFRQVGSHLICGVRCWPPSVEFGAELGGQCTRRSRRCRLLAMPLPWRHCRASSPRTYSAPHMGARQLAR
jgi:hypothetical protein